MQVMYFVGPLSWCSCESKLVVDCLCIVLQLQVCSHCLFLVCCTALRCAPALAALADACLMCASMPGLAFLLRDAMVCVLALLVLSAYHLLLLPLILLMSFLTLL
jgi:hypothetical protein